MTRKGKKNRYNVKLLKGYGCSIWMKGNKVILRGGSDPFSCEAETEEWFVTQIPYERIVISGKGYVLTEAISVLATHNVNVILLDSFGNLITNMCKTMSSDTGTKHGIAQYDTFREAEKVLYLQKKLLFDKLASQQYFLREIKRKDAEKCIEILSSYAENISSCKEKRDLLRIEAGAGRIYFLYYTSLFDSKYGFTFTNDNDMVDSIVQAFEAPSSSCAASIERARQFDTSVFEEGFAKVILSVA